jgi:hypothetical protein
MAFQTKTRALGVGVGASPGRGAQLISGAWQWQPVELTLFDGAAIHNHPNSARGSLP